MISGHYEEISLNENISKSLTKVVDAIGYDKNKVSQVLYSPSLSKEYGLSRVSPETLSKIELSGDRFVATEDCNLLKFNNVSFEPLNKMMGLVLREKFTFSKFGVSGRTWYPENGYMGWHTNSNNKGFRLYCSFARESGKSFFRYRNPETGEVVTSFDKDGWNFRIFRIGDDPLWHCVFSETDRFSIGYTLYS
jgi:hypothetical protein